MAVLGVVLTAGNDVVQRWLPGAADQRWIY